MSSTTTTIDTAPAKYKGKQGSYKCEQFDCFSLDNDHRLVPSNKEAELGFLDESWLNKGGTRLNVSLLEGMTGAVEKRRDESLDKLFQWLMVTSGKGSSLREAVHVDGPRPRFVSRRGPLARLAASPYSADGPHDVGIRVACTKHKGFYFLVEFSTDDKKANEASRDDYQKRTCYAGLRFEQLMTGKVAEEEAKKKKADELHRPLDPNAEHNGVFTGLLKSAAGDPIEILCAAEVDCALEETGEFVELKTQLKQLGWGKAFGYKALSWYLQSYMIGIQQFVVGLHENCILHRVEKHQLEELLNWARAGGGWEPQVCLAFLHSLLGQLKAQLDGQPEGTIVVAERSAHGHQFRLQCILPEDVEGQKRWTVLTEEFKQFDWASE